MTLQNKITGAVRGGALGDSLGLSVETKSRLQIQEQFGEVIDFLPLRTNKFFASGQNKGTFEGDLDSTGYISDDTILTLAGLQSIVNKRSIDLFDIFAEHNKYVKKFGKAGFGKATLRALGMIESGHNPLVAGQHSRGNGVMMKQLPYALYYSFKPHQGGERKMDHELASIAFCTHVTPVALLTAIIHNRMLLKLLNQDSDEKINFKQLFEELLSLAEYYEASDIYDLEDRTKDESVPISEILLKLLFQLDEIQKRRPYSLKKIIETYKAQGDNKGAKYGFHVASTFGFVYSIFLQNQNRQGLLDAINIGEDTDTQAAIIGNMIGAYKGEFYDKSLILQLRNREEIQKVLDATIDTFL